MVTEQPALTFAALLRQLRAEAKLTQEELAAAAGVSPRAVSNLERGFSRTAHKDTAVLLAGAPPARKPSVGAAHARMFQMEHQQSATAGAVTLPMWLV